MTEGVRIDIVAGLPGAGKSTFIRQMLRCVPNKDRIAVCEGSLSGLAFEGHALARRPTRIFLEADGDLDLREAARRALNEDALRFAYTGARVAVVDALRFGMFQRDAQQIEAASHVFLNRAAALGCKEQARMLKSIWSIHPRANVLVDPLDGLNLWMLLDILPAGDLPHITI